MSKSVAVLSRMKNLSNKLKEALPSIDFIEVQSTDSSQLKSSEIIIADYDLIGPQIYNLTNTKWMQGTWAGLDILLPHVQKENPPKFPITRTSGENFGQLMGEYVVSNIVFNERNYFKVKENQNKKLWAPEACQKDHRSIADLTIGILGIGSIGNIISKTLHYLGATIYGFGRRPSIPLETDDYKHIEKYFTKPNLPDLLSSVDYIVNVLPSTEETKNLLGGGILENCKGNSTVFINIGRGSIIAEVDLVNALKQKWISGAVLDVFEKEPLPNDSILWTMPNVFITPHISGNSRVQDIVAKFKKNFELFEQNLPLINAVDFVKGY